VVGSRDKIDPQGEGKESSFKREMLKNYFLFWRLSIKE